MTRYPEIFSASSRRSAGYTQAEPRWHGTGLVYGPSPPERPGGWTEEPVQCDHFHKTIDAAKQCGDRLAAATARKLDREARAYNTAHLCEIAAANLASFPGDGPMWLKHCRTHRASASLLKDSETEALAVEWTCPWAEHVQSPGN